MIGWWIGIAQQTPQERDESADKKAAIIASWEAGSGGLDWLEKLVQEGRATKLSHHGYPCRYVAIARDIQPLIADGPPAHSGPTIIGDDYVTPGGWIGRVEFKSEKISACAPDQVLTVDAWDLD